MKSQLSTFDRLKAAYSHVVLLHPVTTFFTSFAALASIFMLTTFAIGSAVHLALPQATLEYNTFLLGELGFVVGLATVSFLNMAKDFIGALDRSQK